LAFLVGIREAPNSKVAGYEILLVGNKAAVFQEGHSDFIISQVGKMERRYLAIERLQEAFSLR